jgi:hypothetical protein
MQYPVEAQLLLDAVRFRKKQKGLETFGIAVENRSSGE